MPVASSHRLPGSGNNGGVTSLAKRFCLNTRNRNFGEAPNRSPGIGVIYRSFMIRRITSVGTLCLVLASCAAPSVPDQFWWNWWVSAAVAAATFFAVLAALFGPLRSRWFPPLLNLTLLNDVGQSGENSYTLPDGKGERREHRRYYHVQVSNGRRLLSPAEGVQVSLVRIEEPGPGGQLQVTWAGEIPMTWQHQQINPLTRTIGHPYPCDLCSVGEDQGLSLALLIVSFGLEVVVHRKEACTIVVSLQAKGIQADSPICRIKIAWDGKWEDGEIEMKRHLRVEHLVSRRS